MDITHQRVLGFCDRQVERARKATERGDVRRARTALAAAVGLFAVAVIALLFDLVVIAVVVVWLAVTATVRGRSKGQRPTPKVPVAAQQR